MSDAIHNRDAVKALDAFTVADDCEAAHSEAEKILLKFLSDTGNEDVAEAYRRASERVPFWYA